jgi:hypothetical protein
LLALAHIARQRCLVAVQEDNDQRRLLRIETLRHVQKHAPVAIGFVLPISTAAGGSVAAPLSVADVEERPVSLRHLTAIGKGRIIEPQQRRFGDGKRPQFRLCSAGRLAFGRPRSFAFTCGCRHRLRVSVNQ